MTANMYRLPWVARVGQSEIREDFLEEVEIGQKTEEKIELGQEVYGVKA